MSHDSIIISLFLKPEFINLELLANNKENAIRELVAPLVKSGVVRNSESFLNEVFEREEKGSTGIGSGLAIPHCRTEEVSEILISLGRHAEGIEYDSIDDSKAQIFVLLAIPKDKMQTYIKILSKLTKIINTDGFKEKFLGATNKNTILTLFNQTEENLN